MIKKKTSEKENETPLTKEKIFENLIWMTVKDTAKYLSRTENAVRILICRGMLRVYRLGRRVYLNRTEIDTLINSSATIGGY